MLIASIHGAVAVCQALGQLLRTATLQGRSYYAHFLDK